ncbi:hypothetical protein L3X38_038278 [Prunus dulcis]|uniref:Uncharacterized protein n=1 Tax=Prunus dulcis TaxID=3755 RepID=A0AAD4V4Q2_PRUDU|nr:hypothetical protein L3X38_038278 [Prunus dulcis]
MFSTVFILVLLFVAIGSGKEGENARLLTFFTLNTR